MKREQNRKHHVPRIIPFRLVEPGRPEEIVRTPICPYCNTSVEERAIKSTVYTGATVHLDCYYQYEDPR